VRHLLSGEYYQLYYCRTRLKSVKREFTGLLAKV
jgi:hypothetical protein